MAEFVAGQWVKWAGKVWKVAVTQGDGVSLEYQDGTGALQWVGLYCREQPDPFEWKVGKRYKTTLDGVTATIHQYLSNGDLVGLDSRDTEHSLQWVWCQKTGWVNRDKDDASGVHLLPFLADEPSEPEPEPAKPQAPSPYDRVIGGVEVDLWTLADIYEITSHRLFSAWKKITMAGRRGPKDKLRDLREARVGLDKEIAKLEAEGGE